MAKAEKKDEQSEVQETSQEILASDTTLYHADREPKVFAAGAAIPKGWQRSRIFKDFTWCIGEKYALGMPNADKWEKVKR